MRFSISFLICLTLGAIPTLFVSAHGDGASHEEVIDGYFIDIGYDPTEPVADEPIRLDFSVIQEGSTSSEPIFTDVWVRIMHDNQVQFSGGIHRPIFGPTGFAFVPNHAGQYEVLARFQNGSDKIVETSFVLDVQSSDDQKQMPLLIGLFIACCFLGMIGSFLYAQYVCKNK